jgi:hypothetical protein
MNNYFSKEVGELKDQRRTRNGLAIVWGAMLLLLFIIPFMLDITHWEWIKEVVSDRSGMRVREYHETNPAWGWVSLVVGLMILARLSSIWFALIVGILVVANHLFL